MGWLLKLATGNPVTLLWIAASIALVAGAAGATGAWTVQGWRLDSAKAAFSKYRTQVKALGREAEKAAKKAESDNLTAKKRADDENARMRRDLDGVTDAYRRLRDQRSSTGYVPAAAPGARDPDRACFDRDSLNRAIADFDRGVAGLVEKGDQAIVDLNTARAWASATGPPP